MNVAGAREKVGSSVVQQTGIQCFNCKEFRHFSKECRKPKRVKDLAYHKEKMLLCKQAEQGVPLQEEHYMANDEENHALVTEEEAPTEFALMAETRTKSCSPEFLHVYLRYICSNKERLEEGTVAKNIVDDLQSGFLGLNV
nr:hypothetical protein [Tanacetum cinerariifolium]